MPPESSNLPSCSASAGDASPERGPREPTPHLAATVVASAHSPDSNASYAGPDDGPPATPFVGKSLGKYRVIGVLGQGAMGVVLKAHDPTIGRDVAIKVL